MKSNTQPRRTAVDADAGVDAGGTLTDAGGTLTDAGGTLTAAETEQEKREMFARSVEADILAVRRVADLLHDAWVGGPCELHRQCETVALGCRVVSLALAHIERAAVAASLPAWSPGGDGEEMTR